MAASVKFEIHFRCRDNADGPRQQGIACPLKFFGGQPCARLKVGYLAGGMHAGIGASRSLNHQSTAREFFQNIAQYTLHGGLPGLALPSAEIGAVIRQCELYISHGERSDYRT